MPPVERQAQLRVAQAGKLKRHLHHRADQPAEGGRANPVGGARGDPVDVEVLIGREDLQRRREQHRPQHDTSVEDGAR